MYDENTRSPWCRWLPLLALSVAASGRMVGRADMPPADQLYRQAGVEGGLVVLLGCDDAEALAGLQRNARFVVQGLDVNGDRVAAAREQLGRLKKLGPVSVQPFDGRHLPYVDGIVNLVVVGRPFEVERQELSRVLAPGGRILAPQGDQWRVTTKPYPDDIDQWSHFLHDASGNAVAQDARVRSPRHLQWVTDPRWCRSHECPSSVNGVVVAGGRIFTLFDEGPTGVHRGLPRNCKLIARDAFNGKLLWKVALHDWQEEDGTGTGNRWNIHHTIPRRVVAGDKYVYVTLGFQASPVSVLDAATGEIVVEALPRTKGTDELILSDQVLVAKLTQGRSVPATQRIGVDTRDDSLVAIDVANRKVLWRKDRTRVVPYALAATAGRVVYHDLEQLVCLDLATGQTLWTAPSRIVSALGGTSTLVLHDDVVLFHGRGRMELPDWPQPRAAGQAKKKRAKPRESRYLTAYSLADGHRLWQQPGHGSLAGACTQPTDLFVAQGTVWCGSVPEGYDLHTGKVTQKLELWNLVSPGHHYRCFRGKATEHYLIWPKRGAEFVSLDGDQHMRNDWLRAPCFTGATPANGLLYVPPSQCFCYPGVLTPGYQAFSGAPSGPNLQQTKPRVLQGPAFSSPALAADDPQTTDQSPGNWPMYRRDAARSGAQPAAALPGKMRLHWDVALQGPSTQPVIVGDRLWVAERDQHRLRCLDVKTGRERWQFLAGGRIDSPPTVVGDRVYFGCRDGSVVCLRADDGALIWQFVVDGQQRRILARDQLESPWPVHGSVLVERGVVYFAAGYSSFLDGGIGVFGVDAATGQLRYRHVLDGPWPDIKHDVGTPFAMEGAREDLLVSDGAHLFMGRIKFDLQLNRRPVESGSSLGELNMGANHLVATGGFLDDTGYDRVYWMHSPLWPGFYFAQYAPKSGQLVVFNDQTTFAVKYFYRRIQWSPTLYPAGQGYLLFADSNDNQPMLEDRQHKVKALKWLPDEAYEDKFRRGGYGVEKGTGYVRTQPPRWQTMVPIRIRAMTLCGDRLVVVGPPDEVPADDPYGALEGRRGSRLAVFSTADGRLLEQQELNRAPMFDGLSAAGGRLFLATRDGHVMCWAGSSNP